MKDVRQDSGVDPIDISIVPQDFTPPDNQNWPGGEPDASGPDDEGQPEEIDPELRGVLAKFGVTEFEEIPAPVLKMAKSQLHADRKISELGTKAKLWDEMSSSAGRQADEGAGDQQGDILTPAGIAKAVAEAEEAGANPLEVLAESLLSAVQQQLSQVVEPIKRSSNEAVASQIEQQFLTAFPDAPQYIGGISEVLQELPNLIPSDATRDQALKGMQLAYLEAKRRAGALSRPTQPLKRSTTPGSPTGRYVLSASRSQLSSSRSRERKLFDRARDTGDREAWADLLRERLGALARTH